MKRDLRSVALCVAFSQAAEEKITKADLPPAVSKTAEQRNEGATVKRYSKVVENGQLEYEVKLTVNGHSKDLTIVPDGRCIEVEEQVEMNSLPGSVQSALRSRADAKIESLTKIGKIVAYEAQGTNSGRHSEIQVGPEGERLKHEE